MPRRAFRGPQDPRLPLMSALYRKNPVAFVREQLHQEPTDYQIEVLMACADPDTKLIIISASRGAGKTLLVSWIVAWSEACLIDFFGKYECVILGGSGDQSKVMHNYFRQHIETTPMLSLRVVGEPGKVETPLENGYVRALACSEEQVRGRHIELLILDEAAGIPDETILSALPQAHSSKHGRIIMLSTPHVSGGLFQEIWENHEAYGYKRFGPWSMEQVPWFPKEELERAKLLYPKDRYDVEFLGKFPKQGGRVFDIDEIDNAVAKEPFTLNPAYPCQAGVDWGFHNPTVMIFSQEIKGKIYIPGPPKEWVEVHFQKVNEQIIELSKKHRVEMVYADHSHIGENQRLQDKTATEEVKFTRESKAIMRENAANLLHRGLLVISPDHTSLLKQMRKYAMKKSKGAEINTSGKKADEDYVDAFMLSLWDYAENGGKLMDGTTIDTSKFIVF